MTNSLLSVEGLRKSFGGIVALDGVDLALDRGEVHALVGENGAGKSTLIKILTGAFPPDAGTMLLDGLPYAPDGPRAAKAAGLQVVHQEFNLLPHLTVAENVSIEALPRGALGFLDRRAMRARARSALDGIGLADVDVDRSVASLGIAHRQLVEIARALQSQSRILILDEPTATLTARETDRLFGIVRRVRSEGVTVVFVSHHLDEVFAIADRVTVLRSGQHVVTTPIAETSPAEVVRRMVGRDLAAAQSGGGDHAAGPVALSVRGLVTAAASPSSGISFDLRAGEVLGFAGLVGAGRTEVLRAIFGADRPQAGTILRDGQPVAIGSPRDAIRAGLGFVTEDRKEEGLILSMPIAANVSLANLGAVSGVGLMRPGVEKRQAEKAGARLSLRHGGVDQPAASLSGGNQQKVVLAKWLALQPRVLLLDEPTRGVDVGAKAEIYAILRGLASEGVALLVVSSELPELFALCDRILVLAQHRVAGELARPDFSQERILRLAYGQNAVRDIA